MRTVGDADTSKGWREGAQRGKGTWPRCACQENGAKEAQPAPLGHPMLAHRSDHLAQHSSGPGDGGAEPRDPRIREPRVGASQWTVTNSQLVLFHRRQAKHVGVFSSVGFIERFNVDGEFLHKGAGKPVGEEKPPSGPAFWGRRRHGAGWAGTHWAGEEGPCGDWVGGQEAGVVATTCGNPTCAASAVPICSNPAVFSDSGWGGSTE